MTERSCPSFQRWMRQQCDEGVVDSRGTFSMDHEAAGRSGLSTLRLYDVPLLVLAAAVEGGCEEFAVMEGSTVSLQWRGPGLGPSAKVAASLLAVHQVDAVWRSGRLDLPPFFSERLAPLARRCCHAPLSLFWNRTRVSSPVTVPSVQITSGRRSRLVLVDRGVDFDLGGVFPGLEVVAWVPPLPGAPWPSRLRWGTELEHVLGRVLVSVQATTSRLGGA